MSTNAKKFHENTGFLRWIKDTAAQLNGTAQSRDFIYEQAKKEIMHTADVVGDGLVDVEQCLKLLAEALDKAQSDLEKSRNTSEDSVTINPGLQKCSAGALS